MIYSSPPYLIRMNKSYFAEALKVSLIVASKTTARKYSPGIL